MPDREQQRILNELNRERYSIRKYLDRAGWAGFFVGFLFTSLLFILVFIPIAQQEAVHEFQQTQNLSPSN